jgi:hypothetical protein
LVRHHADLGRPLLELAAPHMSFEVVYDACAERTRVVAAESGVLAHWNDRWAAVDVEPHDGISLAVGIRDLR